MALAVPFVGPICHAAPADLASLPDAPDAPQLETPAPPLTFSSSRVLDDSRESGPVAVSYRSPAPALPGAAVTDPNQPNRVLTPQELDKACQSGELRGKPCRLRWWPALWEAFEATAVENSGNIALDSDTRNALTTHNFWGAYVYSVEQYRFGQWSDDTTFIVHDIGHPMQGAAVYAIYAQNDPKQRGMLFRLNDRKYWEGKLKAMAFVTGYEIQWKLGPISEASIGNSGYNTYYTPRVIGRSTNETGFQDFFITPVYGLGWDVMEDMVDKYVMPHIWRKTHNKWILTALLPLTPTRAGANFLRYKPAYYRDYDLPPVRSKD